MNKQIRELAEQAGIPVIEGRWDYNDREILVKDDGEWRKALPSEIINTMFQSEQGLEKFAAIIVAAEREGCARVCEELVLSHPGRADLTADQCAAAIRGRK